VYQLYTIELSEQIDRKQVIETLDQHNIASKVYWNPPVHQTEYYLQSKQNTPQLTMTEHIAKRVLSLPMYSSLSSEEPDRIIEAVSKGIR
jgi:perosamine synthetase